MSNVWPEAVEDGLIPTDNRMGIMTMEVSPAGEAFIELAAGARRPLLEVGAAYGNATLPALATGATVIANDLSASELEVLVRATPEEDRCRLVCMPARFPDELRLAEESLSGVLAAQVLHFFEGDAVERAFANVYRWLEPGGAFFVVVMTPSLSFYTAFAERYRARERAGDRWPGVFDPHEEAPPEWSDRLPSFVHLFEEPVLRRCAEDAGFHVERLEPFCFRHFPDKHRTNGREFLTLTARKPAA